MTAAELAVTTTDDDTGLAHLLGRIADVEQRIRRLVAHRREDDPAPHDPFRGLYVSDEMVRRLLAPRGPGCEFLHRDVTAEQFPAPAPDGRLVRLARDATLSALDLDLLVIALVPDLDRRFERLYGYLNDDVTRRRATIGLALELAGTPPLAAAARARLASGAPLVDRALVVVEDADRPFLTRGLRVPDRVAAHLLGDDAADPVLTDVLVDVPSYEAPVARNLARALGAGVRLAYLREKVVGTGTAVGSTALAFSGRSALCLDLERVAASGDPSRTVAVAVREAMLRGAGLVAAPVEALAHTAPDALRTLASTPTQVVLVGGGTWDPAWSHHVPLQAEAPPMTPADRSACWTRELGARGDSPGMAGATTHFVLGPGQVARAVRAAEAGALLEDGPMTAATLRRGARAQNAAGLERLARRFEPGVTWDDLVLPPPVTRQLHDLAARARHRDRVLSEWRMRPGGGRGRGIAALFAGDSGTGKTMAAEVIAGELGLDLYTVNLATVVDKYVGETEKNLERIFAEAAGVNAVLLFDEADAIFGKRSDVRDAHDRYANIESAYLLQRMETFDGIAILATNLRANIDDAFTRRLDSIIDFPAPDEPLRRALWERSLAPPLPCADDLDLDFCARSFTLSGGNIRSIAVTAAYLAVGADRAVGMAELISAIQQEYRKLGRLVMEREFGQYITAPK